MHALVALVDVYVHAHAGGFATLQKGMTVCILPGTYEVYGTSILALTTCHDGLSGAGWAPYYVQPAPAYMHAQSNRHRVLLATGH